MTVIGAFATTEDWEADLGTQVRRARLDANISQEDLATKANISVGALKKLESGAGSTLKTLIRVVRALGREDWLSQLAPERELGPFDLLQLREGKRPPQRARKERS